jgi:hypothetical protein
MIHGRAQSFPQIKRGLFCSSSLDVYAAASYTGCIFINKYAIDYTPVIKGCKYFL